MTADLPRAVDPGDAAETVAASGVPRLTTDARRAAPVDAGKKTVTADAGDSAPGSLATPEQAPPSSALVLRPTSPPADQLDFADRHDTRATESDEMARRYAELSKDRRKNEWHRLAMSMVAFVVGVIVYLAGFVIVSRLLPNLSPRMVAQVVGIAFAAAEGGVAVREAWRVLTARSRSRDRRSKSV